MTDAVDTSAEAVEAKAQVLDVPDDVLSVTQTQKAARHSAAMLRALLAERDKAYARVDDALDAYAEECRRHGVTRQERDAALAEVKRLREALTKIAARDLNAVGSGKRAIEYDLMRYEARAALAKEASDGQST